MIPHLAPSFKLILLLLPPSSHVSRKANVAAALRKLIYIFKTKAEGAKSIFLKIYNFQSTTALTQDTVGKQNQPLPEI